MEKPSLTAMSITFQKGTTMYVVSLSVCCLCLLLFVENSSSEDLIVDTKYGKVQGEQLRTSNNHTSYCSFRGIPFAQPPINELRFASPKPPKPWPGIRNATKDGNSCMQAFVSTALDQSEDCLYLNVYTPTLNPVKPLVVMVWIYGGFFLRGSASPSDFGPDFLVERNVIVVTLNYRVGIFGFFCTEDDVAPGNFALKDQILALKWVNENIKNFGGDPDQVTLFGESAGAAAVSYLVISPLSTGLFQRAIMQSGNALCLWALSREPRTISFAVGRFLGIRTNDSTTLVSELRKVNALKLQFAATAKDLLKTLSTNIRDGLYFAPVLEPPHDGAVVTGNSHELLHIGKFNQIPIMVGYNSAEGNPFEDVIELFRLYLIQYDANPRNLIPTDMNARDDKFLQNIIGKKIREEFFPSGSIALSNNKISAYISSDMFVRPTNELVRLTSRRVPVYFYRFAYEGHLGNPTRKDPGVGHGEDLAYIWRDPVDYHDGTQEDKMKRYQIVKLWTNFAKYSNPTPEIDENLDNVSWPASDPGNLTYLSIDTKLSVATHPDNETVQFWKSMYQQYGHPPYDTY